MAILKGFSGRSPTELDWPPGIALNSARSRWLRVQHCCADDGSLSPDISVLVAKDA